ncbi:MAG: GNAT family N-acetyltransferase [Clostridia bacterium]|nr:GNAT family N-acetyltransferase [Clostridia bacterium]
MTIKTPRLTLVPLDLTHLQDVHSCLSDRELTRLMVFNPKSDIEETRELISANLYEFSKASPDFLEFAAISDEGFVGNLTLYFFYDRPDTAEFAWVISKSHLRKGYAFEAVKGLIRHFHENFGINRFLALCDSENSPSISLAKKLGMKHINTSGGRFNRSDPKGERTEYTFELVLDNNL